MENFTEFDNLTTTPQKDSSSIISHAFGIYKKTFLYAILAIVLTIIGSYIFSFFAELITGFDAESMQEFAKSGSTDYKRIFMMPGYGSFLGLNGLFGLLLYPIYAGFLYILNKANFNEQILVSDLFIGYKQNTLQIILYGIISNIILTIAFSLCFLPGLFLAPLFIFAFPILFFENTNAIDAIKKSFKIAQDNYWTIWVIAVLAFLISISGLILCFVGIILTAPFLYAAIYSAYCAYNGAPKPIIKE
ncbi:beta-carotene 15,15'-monooxygenase [Halpernia sp.]|uniref:beta-carotene 15,15'-monooxygenase n=1 Tax=Halpernia sp. TaxID=2782209 RepID=UPI003A8DCB0E